jgi:prevent-host-death family protein
MKRIAAGEFKARCLGILDQVRATGEPYVVTKRGVPVAQLVPVPKAKPERKKSIFGCLVGTMAIVGDIDVSPWEEEFGDRDPIVEKWDRLNRQ